LNNTSLNSLKSLDQKMKYLPAFFLFLFTIACSSQPGVDLPEEISSLENLAVFTADTEPTGEITLTPEAVYGDTDEVLLSEWLTVHIDSRGRVFVGDNRETVIHLYNPDGTYNRQVGREGDGPGEYRSVGVMKSDENYFYHFDRNNSRITRYHADTFRVVDDVVFTVPRNDDEPFFRSASTFYLAGDNHYLIGLGMGFRAGRPDIDMSKRKTEAQLMNAETGEFLPGILFSFPASDALVEFRDNGSMSVMSVPYKRSSVMRVTDEEVIHGWNEHFLFRFYDRQGTYLRSIYYNHSNPPLQRNVLLEMYEDRGEPWHGMVRNDEMPENWPAWHTFHQDDEGRLWVEKTTDDPELSEYHILDPGGALLAVLPWSRDKQVQHIQDEFLYSLEENEDGLREVVKYSFDL
jgi:hypothetical protein